MFEKKKKIIVISGPTATGKSALGVRLAKDLNGEIISADSMQVYKYLDIGTAKITDQEACGIRHHMIDVVDPTVNYSIADYKVAAKKCVEDIVSRGKLPIVVGGTGFYIHALLYDTDFDENENDGSIRKRIEAEMEKYGPEVMHERLRTIDPESADIIHANNIKRVVRALEFYEINGYKISEHNKAESIRESPYDYLYFALDRNKDDLYEAIDRRVDEMVEKGLFDEVSRLREMGCNSNCICMQGIGYKESTAEEIKTNTHHYVKRQITWLKREKNIIWVNAPVTEEDYQWILQKCMNL